MNGLKSAQSEGHVSPASSSNFQLKSMEISLWFHETYRVHMDHMIIPAFTV